MVASYSILHIFQNENFNRYHDMVLSLTLFCLKSLAVHKEIDMEEMVPYLT
jgi:hypothetical protein